MKKAALHTLEDLHKNLFSEGPPKPISVEEMDEGSETTYEESMRSFDTNVLVRPFVGDDSKQVAPATKFI